MEELNRRQTELLEAYHNTENEDLVDLVREHNNGIASTPDYVNRISREVFEEEITRNSFTINSPFSVEELRRRAEDLTNNQIDSADQSNEDTQIDRVVEHSENINRINYRDLTSQEIRSYFSSMGSWTMTSKPNVGKLVDCLQFSNRKYRESKTCNKPDCKNCRKEDDLGKLDNVSKDYVGNYIGSIDPAVAGSFSGYHTTTLHY